MKKRKFIGAITFLTGLPGLAVIAIMFWGEFVFSYMTLLIIAAFIFRGVCGVTGGVLLWQGKKLGYQLSILTWLYLVIIAFAATYQMFFTDIFTSYAFTVENKMFTSFFGKTMGKFLWGVPILYILIRDIKSLEQSISNDTQS